MDFYERDAGQGWYDKIKAVVSDPEREEIKEGEPLSILVRSDWYDPRQRPEPEQYMILLAAGGPTVRIVGRLNDENNPSTARIQVHGGLGPWEDFEPADEGDVEATLLGYAHYYFTY
jgi:hypothetical protein